MAVAGGKPSPNVRVQLVIGPVEPERLNCTVSGAVAGAGIVATSTA